MVRAMSSSSHPVSETPRRPRTKVEKWAWPALWHRRTPDGDILKCEGEADEMVQQA